MNPSQEKAWETHADRLVIEVPQRELSTSVHPDAHVDWEAAFGRSAPLFVEIGSGRGEALVAIAEQHPEANVVAFEVFTPAVASTLSRINRHGLENVRVVLANGVEGLEHLFAPASVTQLMTFFPDPWHKPRHHKRRLVSADFAQLVASRLVPGGLWRLATDWEDYALAMREVLDVAPGLENVHGGWAPRWEERPVTKYEARGLAAGRAVFDLAYRRTDAVLAEPAASEPKASDAGSEDVPTVGDLTIRTPIPGASDEGWL